MDPNALKALSQEEFNTHLKTLNTQELLEILEWGMKDLEDSVEALHKSVVKQAERKEDITKIAQLEWEALIKRL